MKRETFHAQVTRAIGIPWRTIASDTDRAKVEQGLAQYTWSHYNHHRIALFGRIVTTQEARR